jgi:aminoglycoside 3-N-acetyltransferase
MLNFNTLIQAFEPLGLQKKIVIAHASLRAFGQIDGGADALVTAMLYSVGGVFMPTHTYKPMVTPVSGPANNAVNYAIAQQWNRLAETYYPDMPADRMMGVVPENLRQRPKAYRSMHPILSFSGLGVKKMLEKQTLAKPFEPILDLAEEDGWVLFLGVDHTANTSIHIAEKLAGRKQFTRWAQTDSGVVACPGFPGCSAGFQDIEPDMRPFTKTIQVGAATVSAFPVRALIVRVIERIKKDPQALLCQRVDCERCSAVREGLRH